MLRGIFDRWWLILEMTRTLILTSTLGFLSSSCYVKLLMAQIISFAFLLLFLSVHPYRRKLHNLLQGFVMSVPVFTVGWGLAGGWENAEHALNAAETDRHVSYDEMSLVALHGAIIVPPVLMALFTLFSTAFVWCRAKKEHGRDSTTRTPKKRGRKKRKKKTTPSKSNGEEQSWSSWSSYSLSNSSNSSSDPEEEKSDATQPTDTSEQLEVTVAPPEAPSERRSERRMTSESARFRAAGRSVGEDPGNDDVRGKRRLTTDSSRSRFPAAGRPQTESALARQRRLAVPSHQYRRTSAKPRKLSKLPSESPSARRRSMMSTIAGPKNGSHDGARGSLGRITTVKPALNRSTTVREGSTTRTTGRRKRQKVGDLMYTLSSISEAPSVRAPHHRARETTAVEGGRRRKGKKKRHGRPTHHSHVHRKRKHKTEHHGHHHHHHHHRKTHHEDDEGEEGQYEMDVFPTLQQIVEEG